MRFGMELHREKGEGLVRDAFYRVVVEAPERDLPIFRKRFLVDGKSMILRCEETLFLFQIHARMVLTPMPKF